MAHTLRLPLIPASVIVLLLSFAGSANAQPSASYQLSTVQVTGIKRYSQDDVARLSGLKAGESVNVAQLASAAERLAGTGLFRSVKYRYATAGTRMVAVFEIEEAEWTIPVVFDNFVWFSDAELAAALAHDVPTFDGTLPASEQTPDLVTHSLQKLLNGRKIAGRATFEPQTDLATKKLRYLFKVEEPAPLLCAMNFPGASAAPERELVDAARAAIGKPYSRFYITSLSSGTFLDVYHRRGYWRASFAPPAPRVDAPGCTGVSAAVSVTEGSVYAFDKAHWIGNQVLAAGDLDTLLGLKPGDVASSSKVDAGLIAIRRAYAKRGYLVVRQSAAPVLDDAVGRAAFDVKVDEGPQFLMGTLEFSGVSDADARRLTKNWKLAAGQPFDDFYPQDFITKEVLPLLAAGVRGPSTERSVDSEKHIVNLKIVFQR